MQCILGHFSQKIVEALENSGIGIINQEYLTITSP